MSFFKLVIFIICFHAFSVFAGTIDCEPATTTKNSYNQWSTIHTSYELKPSGTNITLGGNIPDWSVIYTLNHVVVGVTSGSCSLDVNVAYFYSSPYTTLLNTISGHKIYATNVPGIGMSITAHGDGKMTELGPYPDYHYTGLCEDNTCVGTYYDADIRFWKIPGKIPMTAGPISIDGPEMGIMYYGNTYTMISNDPSRLVPFSGSTSGNGYLAGSRIIHATLIFQPGTCNVEGDNVNVNMGDYDGTGGHSIWKDASFKIVCPDAYGYGGSYTTADYTDIPSTYNSPYAINPTSPVISANNTANGRVMLSIVPYTEVIDANKGIIALDGTGAQGYGIQLAWGDYSSQSSADPANPVILNTYVDANSLNSGFGAGDTPIGGNAFTGTDNTIKMAARYIRITGDTAPGPANAVVQVIANYQ